LFYAKKRNYEGFGIVKRSFCQSLAAVLFVLFLLLSIPSSTHAQSSEITFFTGGFFGDSFISQPDVIFGDPVNNTVFDDQVAVGFRYAYFLNSFFALEGGVGFTPASIVSSLSVDGGSNFRSVVDVNTYIFQGNVVAHLFRGPIIPYVTGGVAAVHFDFRRNQFDFVTPSETDFALNAGGGFKIPVGKETAIRADGRVFWMDPSFSVEESIRFVEVTGGVSILFDF